MKTQICVQYLERSIKMTKRKGLQMSRLERSQNAHGRLREKWFGRPGKHASVKHK